MEGSSEQDFLQFLNRAARADLKVLALEWLLGFTGTPEGKKMIIGNGDYITAIIDLLQDESNLIRKDAFLSLINLTAEEDFSQKLVTHNAFFTYLLEYSLNPTSEFADQSCMILANISRSEKNCQTIIKNMTEDCIHKVVYALCQELYNEKASLKYLAPFLSNLSQLFEGRQMIMNKDQCIIQRLLPLVVLEKSYIKRGGIVGTLHNCCFDTEYHEWLLSPEVDILPRLLLPLAGPEEFDDEEMEKLPVDLQYLPEEKQREPDPDIRKMLIESIHQLCASKAGRKIVKEKQTYLIMRELHKWEKDRAVKVACENLVDILIGEEPPENMADLKSVKIPFELSENFKKIDLELLKEN